MSSYRIQAHPRHRLLACDAMTTKSGTQKTACVFESPIESRLPSCLRPNACRKTSPACRESASASLQGCSLLASVQLPTPAASCHGLPELSVILLLSVQECGETAAWSFKDFGANNDATLTELLASFFVLYHTCIAQWCRDRSNGMRYRFLHLHVISNTFNTMFPVFCSC